MWLHDLARRLWGVGDFMHSCGYPTLVEPHDDRVVRLRFQVETSSGTHLASGVRMIGELKDSEIDHLLRSESVGRLGCSAEGRVYIVPVTYAFEEGCVYGHSGLGMKVRMMRANPQVCFEVDRVINQSNWQSVIAWGTYEELQTDEAMVGLQHLLARLGPMVLGFTGVPSQTLSAPLVNLAHHLLQQGVVYRIRLTERSGRFERIV
jgi:uncharacterized protein